MTNHIPALLQSLKAAPAYHCPVQQARPMPLSVRSATNS